VNPSSSNQNNEDVVFDWFLSSSLLPDFSSSAADAASSSLPAASTTEAKPKRGSAIPSGDDKRSYGCREWQPGDWCCLKEEKDVAVKEEQEEIVAKDGDVHVEEEQETAVSTPKTSSPKPIQTRTNPKQNRPSPSGCRLAKRKAAAAVSSAVGDNDNEGDIDEDCKEDYELVINDCSNSAEIQGPKMKKTRKELYQETLDKQWESMFRLLLEYKTQHGNTLVPQKYDQNPRLGTWVDTQRTMHSKNKLSSDRVLRLESIGFVFDRSESNWMHMYCQLCSYKEKHGSTTVPLRWTEVPSLGEWVYVQRYRCEKKERVKLLDDIGFVRHTNK